MVNSRELDNLLQENSSAEFKGASQSVVLKVNKSKTMPRSVPAPQILAYPDGTARVLKVITFKKSTKVPRSLYAKYIKNKQGIHFFVGQDVTKEQVNNVLTSTTLTKEYVDTLSEMYNITQVKVSKDSKYRKDLISAIYSKFFKCDSNVTLKTVDGRLVKPVTLHYSEMVRPSDDDKDYYVRDDITRTYTFFILGDRCNNVSSTNGPMDDIISHIEDPVKDPGLPEELIEVSEVDLNVDKESDNYLGSLYYTDIIARNAKLQRNKRAAKQPNKVAKSPINNPDKKVEKHKMKFSVHSDSSFKLKSTGEPVTVYAIYDFEDLNPAQDKLDSKNLIYANENDPEYIFASTKANLSESKVAKYLSQDPKIPNHIVKLNEIELLDPNNEEASYFIDIADIFFSGHIVRVDKHMRGATEDGKEVIVLTGYAKDVDSKFHNIYIQINDRVYFVTRRDDMSDSELVDKLEGILAGNVEYEAGEFDPYMVHTADRMLTNVLKRIDLRKTYKYGGVEFFRIGDSEPFYSSGYRTHPIFLPIHQESVDDGLSYIIDEHVQVFFPGKDLGDEDPADLTDALMTGDKDAYDQLKPMLLRVDEIESSSNDVEAEILLKRVRKVASDSKVAVKRPSKPITGLHSVEASEFKPYIPERVNFKQMKVEGKHYTEEQQEHNKRLILHRSKNGKVEYFYIIAGYGDDTSLLEGNSVALKRFLNGEDNSFVPEDHLVSVYDAADVLKDAKKEAERFSVIVARPNTEDEENHHRIYVFKTEYTREFIEQLKEEGYACDMGSYVTINYNSVLSGNLKADKGLIKKMTHEAIKNGRDYNDNFLESLTEVESSNEYKTEVTDDYKLRISRRTYPIEDETYVLFVKILKLEIHNPDMMKNMTKLSHYYIHSDGVFTFAVKEDAYMNVVDYLKGTATIESLLWGKLLLLDVDMMASKYTGFSTNITKDAEAKLSRTTDKTMTVGVKGSNDVLVRRIKNTYESTGGVNTGMHRYIITDKEGNNVDAHMLQLVVNDSNIGFLNELLFSPIPTPRPDRNMYDTWTLPLMTCIDRETNHRILPMVFSNRPKNKSLEGYISTIRKDNNDTLRYIAYIRTEEDKLSPYNSELQDAHSITGMDARTNIMSSIMKDGTVHKDLVPITDVLLYEAGTIESNKTRKVRYLKMSNLSGDEKVKIDIKSVNIKNIVGALNNRRGVNEGGSTRTHHASGRDKSPKPDKRDKSPKPDKRDKSPKPDKRDKSPKPDKRDKSPKPDKRDKSPKRDNDAIPPKPVSKKKSKYNESAENMGEYLSFVDGKWNKFKAMNLSNKESAFYKAAATKMGENSGVHPYLLMGNGVIYYAVKIGKHFFYKVNGEDRYARLERYGEDYTPKNKRVIVDTSAYDGNTDNPAAKLAQFSTDVFPSGKAMLLSSDHPRAIDLSKESPIDYPIVFIFGVPRPGENGLIFIGYYHKGSIFYKSEQGAYKKVADVITEKRDGVTAIVGIAGSPPKKPKGKKKPKKETKTPKKETKRHPKDRGSGKKRG